MIRVLILTYLKFRDTRAGSPLGINKENAVFVLALQDPESSFNSMGLFPLLKNESLFVLPPERQESIPAHQHVFLFPSAARKLKSNSKLYLRNSAGPRA